MKKTKKLLCLVLALVMSLSLVACGGGSEGEGEGEAIDHSREVVFGSASLVSNFNIKYCVSANDIQACDQVYDTLFRKVNGEFVSRLADSWEISEDGLDYTFHLNPNATFSDGSPITAEDVEFSYEFIRDDCDNWAWLYTTLEDVEVIDTHTVVFHFTQADAGRMSTMCATNYGAVVSKAALEKWGDDYGKTAESIVSSGAYVVTEWKENEYVKFAARDDYYGTKPDIVNMKYVPIADVNAAVVALQTGELDLYWNPMSGVALDTVKAAENVAVTEALTCRNESVYMNCETGIFTDVRMRQAVAYAINKEEALEVCGSGQGIVVTYPCDLGERVTGNPNFTPSHTYEYNVEKAKELVAECGNVGATVTIKSYNTEPYQTLSVWLQGVLTAIGLDAKVDTMERSAFLDQCLNGEVEICPFSWSTSSFDFGTAVGIYMNSSCIGISGNYSRYNNPKADELVALGNSTSDEEVRKGYYKDLIELYMEEVPSVAMYAVINAIAHSDQLVLDDATQNFMDLVHWAE